MRSESVCGRASRLFECLAFLGEVCVAEPHPACKRADPSGHSLCLELKTAFTISIVNCYGH